MTTGVDLLERDGELATLAELIKAGVSRRGRLVAIQGQAGIGKTRLLDFARAEAAVAGLRVLYARGSLLERSFAFGIVRQLFEALLTRAEAGEKKELLAGSAALSLPVFDVPSKQSPSQPADGGELAVLHGLFWLAANLADRQPLLIAVDDLQWADTPSLEWLGYLARRLEDVPIAVAVAFRPAEVEADPLLVDELTFYPSSTLLRPAPLGRSAAEHLAESILGAPPEPGFTSACMEASGGNPLLLVELLDGLSTEGIAPVAGEVPHVKEIGAEAVSRSVRRRLSVLPPEAQAFARALAVVGDEEDIDLVADLALLGGTSASDAAHRLEEVGVIRSGDALSFVHPLVRDAVYLQMSRTERREAHRRAASLLDERRLPAEQAAAHLLLTPRAGDPWAVTVLRRAAGDALARSSPAIAAVYLGRALDEPPASAERADLLFALGSAEALTRDPEAEVHLREALALAADASTMAEVALTLARLLFWRHAAAEAVTLLEETIAGLGERLPDQRTRLEAELVGMVLTDPGKHAAVSERLSHNVDTQDESVGGKMLLAFAAYRDTLRGVSRERCIDWARRALDGGALLAEEVSPALVATVLTLLYSDELEMALQVSQRGLTLAETKGAPASFALASAGVARALHDMGRLLEAEAIGSVGLAACPPDQAVASAYAAGSLVKVLLKRGDLEGAGAALSEAGLDSGHVPMSLHAADPLNALGSLHLAQSQPSAALEDYLAIRDLVEPSGCRNPAVAPWRSGAALALQQLDRRDEALPLAREELELSRVWGAPTAIGRSLRAIGLIEGGRRGLDLLEESVAVLGASPAAFELLQSQVELGAALRRSNRRADARELLRDCLDRAERSGAGLLARQAREELLATGARPRRLVVTGVESLTPSERRIAALAAEGMTNREIAQSLFVTTKTVEMHLAHVFTKLEIRSRVELGTALGAPPA